MTTDCAEYSFQLDNQFFADIDSPDIQKGLLDVLLTVTKTSGIYRLDFQIRGMVIITCDRCLDEMEQPVDTKDTLKVKMGEELTEIDDIVVVPEDDGYINVAWFLYEFIALSLPMKHMHPVGKCNKDMVHQLQKHLCSDADDENYAGEDKETDDIDPRWNELKKILDNN